MNIIELRNYCLSKKGSQESFPFDLSTLVFKVADKIFAITDINSDILSVNLKCEPEYAIELKEKYAFVKPGYHMHKKYWNTILVESCDDVLLKKLIDHSYSQIIINLLKYKQEHFSNNLI